MSCWSIETDSLIFIYFLYCLLNKQVKKMPTMGLSLAVPHFFYLVSRCALNTPFWSTCVPYSIHAGIFFWKTAAAVQYVNLKMFALEAKKKKRNLRLFTKAVGCSASEGCVIRGAGVADLSVIHTLCTHTALFGCDTPRFCSSCVRKA